MTSCLRVRSGIAEAWLVNLPAETVEVHSEPVNGAYRKVVSYRRGDSIAPGKFPDISIEVAGILA